MSNTLPTSVASSLNEVYPVFEPNQLLTSNHLNQLRNYLDTQDRLSRIKLVGMGIVCGFEVSFTANKLSISKGTGVTSEGFLINIESEEFSKCSEEKYLDPQGYNMFMATEESQIPMWELLPDSDETTPAKSFESLSPATFLNDKVVVLFMEYVDIDLETCLTQNCDDKGVSRDFTVRKLLLQCSDVDRIIRQGYELAEGAGALATSFHKRFVPDYAAMPSFTFVPLDTPTDAYFSAYTAIDTSAEIRARYQALYPESDSNPLVLLAAKIQVAYTTYTPFVGTVATQAQINAIQGKLVGYYNSAKDSDRIQYVYDFSKDIIKAYNEFIDGAFELVAECCPSEIKFPRHLVLAKVKTGAGCPETDVACKPALYRTHFIQAPIYNLQKLKLAEVRNNFNRLIQMIDRFSISADADLALKITPSNERCGDLSNQSIPFYYQPVTQLYKYWNYELAKKCKSDWNLGYWSNLFEVPVLSSQRPLEFNMDESNFYRIEAILGKTYKSVRDELELLKRKHQLDFEILPLKLKMSKNAPNEVCCGIVDIKEDYLQKRNEILAQLKIFYNYYLRVSFLISNLPSLIAAFKEREMDGVEFKKVLDEAYQKYSEEFHVSEFESVIKTLPKCVDDFDPDKFMEAIRVMNQLIVLTILELETTFRMNDRCIIAFEFIIDRYLTTYGFIQGIQGLYNQLLSQLDAQLLSIYFSYQVRLEGIQRQTLFSNFAANNPGLTHRAGVPKGGTFLLVYDQDNTNETIVADFALTGKPCCEDRFAFCSNNPPSIPPFARDIYVFVERSREPKEFIEITIDGAALDYNPIKPVLKAVEVNLSSRVGAEISIEDSDKASPLKIRYQPKFDEKIIYDVFDYMISNPSSGERAIGWVYILIVPEFSAIDFLTELGCGRKVDDPPIVVIEDDGGVKVDEPVKGYTWTRITKEVIDSKDLFGGKTEVVSVVDDRFNETRELYEGLQKEVAIADPLPPKEVLKREADLVDRYSKVMSETANSMAVLSRKLGTPPKTKTELVEYNLKNSGTIKQRRALVALYENQLESFLSLVVFENLGVSPKGSASLYISEGVAPQIVKIAAVSSRSVAIMDKVLNEFEVGAGLKGAIESTRSKL